MDVWFDSGTSWTLMLNGGQPQAGPLADVYVEGTDQHRGWFQSSLLTNIAHQKSMNSAQDLNSPSSGSLHAPFGTLVTHGFTLDAQGKKMSKSLGNVIAPDQIVSGFAAPPKQAKQKREVHPLGPDALRLWVASSEWTKDVVISEKVVSSVHGMLDKYRLTMRMLLGMLADFKLETAIPYDEMAGLDQIALLHLYQVSSSVRKAYTDFEFHKANAAVYRWVTTDLSSFYFEAIKDVLYCDAPTSSRRLSAQTTLHHIFLQLQNMLGPMTPLLVEESWEHSSDSYKTSLEHPLRRVWTDLPSDWHDMSLKSILPYIMAINSSVKTAQEIARTQKLMGQSLASDVIIHLQRDTDLSVVRNETWRELLVVSAVEIVVSENTDTVSAETNTSPSWSFANDVMSPDRGKLGTVAVKSPHSLKCSRCWKYVVECGPTVDHGNPLESEDILLCGRCTDAVAEFQQRKGD